MIEFKKQGQMYIAYENNKMKYGFIVKNNNYKNFILLDDKTPKYIYLPKICEDNKPVKITENLDLYNKFRLQDYLIYNSVCVCTDCFKLYKDLNIVVPFNNCVMFDWGCFDKGVNVNLYLPDYLELKQIEQKNDSLFKCGYDHWTAVTQKDLNGSFSINENETYSVVNFSQFFKNHPFDEPCADFNVFDISKIENKQNSEDEKSK